MSGTFLYFAYGSNLSTEVIQVNSPSATHVGIARLEDYELTFATYSKRWRGAVATLAYKPGSHVWGALWEIDETERESLYRQEGVYADIYRAVNLEVILSNGYMKKCTLFLQKTEPKPIRNLIRDLPDDRKPSTVYINTIIKGAEESGLPEYHIKFLREIPHNGYNGEADLNLSLEIK